MPTDITNIYFFNTVVFLYTIHISLFTFLICLHPSSLLCSVGTQPAVQLKSPRIIVWWLLVTDEFLMASWLCRGAQNF